MGRGAPSNMRLFNRRQEGDAALVDRDGGKVYDPQARNKKKKKNVVSSATAKKSQNQAKKRYDSPFRSSPHEHATIPMIDRIPTAIGYHSDGSEEEWLEEKSKCSRYDAPDDDEDDLREELSLSDGEGGDDKYSVGRKADGIERLWSEDSFDSKQRQQTWDQYDEKQRIESYYKPGDVSYLVEAKNDPIYESPRNSPVKEAIVVAPDLVEQSVATAKPKTKQQDIQEKNGETNDSKRSTETTERKLEVDATPEADATPKADATAESKPELPTDQETEVAAPIISGLKLDSEASKELDAMMSNEQSSDDPMETMAATDLLVKEIETKLKTLKAAAAKEKKALKKLQRENKRSQSRGRSMERPKNPPRPLLHRSLSKTPNRSSTRGDPVTAPEITKSLLSGFTVMLFRKSGEKLKAQNEVPVTLNRKDEDEPPMLEGKLVRQTIDPESPMLEGKVARHKIDNGEKELGEELNETAALANKESMSLAHGAIDDTHSKNKTSLWSHRFRSVFGDKSKTELDDLQHPRSPTLSDPPEHDEYSIEGPPAQTPPAPALVQCLKFYSCDGIAENIGETMKVADQYRNAGIVLCGSPTFSMEREPSAVTPKPTVEVVLEEIERPEGIAVEQKKSEEPPKRGFFSQKNAASIADLTPEAPVWVSSKHNPKILNVTGLTLHLDGDSEPGQAENAKSAKKEMKDSPEDNASSSSSTRVSITSIKVPTKTKRSTGGDVPRNRRRLPRFLQKLSSKKQV